MAQFEYQNELFNVHWKVEPFGVGLAVSSKFDMNYRWDTDCEFVETRRVFRTDKSNEPLKDQILEQYKLALKDLAEKIEFIYKANHGLLDHGNVTIRFKR